MQRRITKDLLTYLPARALPALAAFITVPIYTHLFSPAEFGNYVLAVAAAEFLLLATVTGFGQAAVRFFSAYQLRSGLSSYFAVRIWQRWVDHAGCGGCKCRHPGDISLPDSLRSLPFALGGACPLCRELLASPR